MLDRPNTKTAWLARAAALKPEGRAFIDGDYTAAVSGETFSRVSPIDGRVLAEIASGDAADIDRAVAAARRTFEAGVWRDADAAQKKKVLLRFAELIREHADEIALLETLDVGKPIANSLAVDVPFCASCIQYYAEFADKLNDEIAPVAGPDELALVRREPLGVIGAIVPWNYPLIIAAWKIGPRPARRQFRRAEAGRAILAGLARARAARRRGGSAAGRAQRRAGLRGKGREGAGPPSQRRHGQLHRLD